jgi:phage repressor protein C with HTH and peptisase S24 domain
MEPELSPGDVIVVEYPRRQPAMRLLKENELVAVTNQEWEDHIKRFHFDSVAHEDTLVSTNPAYGPIPVPGPKDVRFVGRVIMVLKGES